MDIFCVNIAKNPVFRITRIYCIHLYICIAASRVCSSTGQWELPDLSQCDTLHNVRGVLPVVIPDNDCFDSFLARYLSYFLLIRDNLANADKLHLAGDLSTFSFQLLYSRSLLI